MSIVIKDMEMPKTCFVCRFQDIGFCHAVHDHPSECEYIPDELLDKTRPGWCPLEEHNIKDNGFRLSEFSGDLHKNPSRLVDMKELQHEIWERQKMVHDFEIQGSSLTYSGIEQENEVIMDKVLMEEYKQECEAVKALGEQIGYGNLMTIAGNLWALDLINSGLPNSGAFYPTILSNMKLGDLTVSEITGRTNHMNLFKEWGW